MQALPESSLEFLTRDAERAFATELAEHRTVAKVITDQWFATPPAGFQLSNVDWSAATVEELYRLLLESDDAEFVQHVAMFLGEGLVRLCGWNWTIAWVPPEYPGMIMYEFGVAPPDLQQNSFPLSWVHTVKDIRKGHSLGSISNIVDTIEQHRKHDPS